jgi:hypothetical protein
MAVMLTLFVMLNVYAECHYTKCLYAECHYVIIKGDTQHNKIMY